MSGETHRPSARAARGEGAGNPLARVAPAKANGVLRWRAVRGQRFFSPCSAGGFTLVELLLVLALLGLLSSVAVPRLNRSVRERELSLASNDLTATLATARAEAVRRGVKVRFTFDSRTREYGLSVQQLEGDRPGDFGAFGDDWLDARRTLSQGLTIEGLSVPGGAGNELVFEPSGLAEVRELRLVDPDGRVAGIGIAQWYEDVNRTAPR